MDSIYLFFSKKGLLARNTIQPFVFENVTYQSIDHWIMVQKALLFHDDEAYSQLLKERDMFKCYEISSKIRGFDIKTWREEQLCIIQEGYEYLCRFNTQVKEYLRSTGYRIIAEVNTNSTLGIGPKECEVHEWKGDNVVGCALMCLRSEMF